MKQQNIKYLTSPVFWSIILITLVAIGFHSYLTIHFFQQQVGTALNESLCNINSTFNCDAVSASAYAQLFDVPLALLGIIANLVFIIFLFFSSTKDEIQRLFWSRWSFRLALFIASMSVIMGLISFTLLSTFCLFCIATYICSWIGLALLWILIPSPRIWSPSDSNYIPHIFPLILLGLIPVLGWSSAQIIYKNLDYDQLQTAIKQSLLRWEEAPTYSFDEQGVVLGTRLPESKIEIIEFSDFLCPHCQHAVPTLDTFKVAHPEVNVLLKIFPLDGTCTPGLNIGNGIRCRLAQAVFCANRMNQGWNAYKWIFKHQQEWVSNIAVDEKLGIMANELHLSIDDLRACIDSNDSLLGVQRQAEQGLNAQLQGTPTVFINGKYLPQGYSLPILEAAIKKINN